MEILLPVAAVIKFEASLPVVKKFVGMLFSHCFEQAKRVRHSAVSGCTVWVGGWVIVDCVCEGFMFVLRVCGCVGVSKVWYLHKYVRSVFVLCIDVWWLRMS